jgi:hypothetical protein
VGIPNATHQASATAVRGLGAYISAHTAAGGTTGASEATGGGYARQLTTWTDGSTGVSNGSAVNVPVAAGTYVEGGIWSAVTAGTFVGSQAFTGGNVVVSGTGASITITPQITA